MMSFYCLQHKQESAINFGLSVQKYEEQDWGRYRTPKTHTVSFQGTFPTCLYKISGQLITISKPEEPANGKRKETVKKKPSPKPE